MATNHQSSEAELATVHGILAQLRRRQRLLNMLRGVVIGCFAGLVGAIAFVAADWIAGWSAESASGIGRLAAISAGIVVVSSLLGALVGLAQKIADLRLARALDRVSHSHDTFASALQLADHHRRERARLIASDAVRRVAGTSPASALPIILPRIARWSLMPLAILCALLAFLPGRSRVEAAAPVAEVSAEEWQSLHEDFVKELNDLRKPETPEEEEMRKMLEELAQLLEQNPEKKDVLKEIARIAEKVEQQRQALSTGDLNMRQAANAIARSEALKQFAATLKQGEYEKAATELETLAEQMESGELSPDATEFEAMSQDLEKLAQELKSQKDLQQAAQDCSKCAGSMSKKELSEAMKRLAQQMRSNCKSMCKGDGCRQALTLLEMLKRGMSQCKGGSCKGSGLMPGQRPGGLKAGWGSAAKWNGGTMARADEARTPEMANDIERQGQNTSFKIVSPDERAESGKSYEELYAEFVQKTEADLELDNVPVAYRDYLRKYFHAIKPQDTPAAPAE